LGCLDATVKTIGAGKNTDRPTFTSISGDVTGNGRYIRLSELSATPRDDSKKALAAANVDTNRENPKRART
jgi:hypothetical protein